VVRFTPRPLYHRRMNPHYPLDRRLGGPQGQFGRRGEEKIINLTGVRTPILRPSSLYTVAIPIALSRLLNEEGKVEDVLATKHHHMGTASFV
jgi:hypothetical protein